MSSTELVKDKWPVMYRTQKRPKNNIHQLPIMLIMISPLFKQTNFAHFGHKSILNQPNGLFETDNFSRYTDCYTEYYRHCFGTNQYFIKAIGVWNITLELKTRLIHHTSSEETYSSWGFYYFLWFYFLSASVPLVNTQTFIQVSLTRRTESYE